MVVVGGVGGRVRGRLVWLRVGLLLGRGLVWAGRGLSALVRGSVRVNRGRQW